MYPSDLSTLNAYADDCTPSHTYSREEIHDMIGSVSMQLRDIKA